MSFEATGLCHSDHHMRTGDLPGLLPVVGGHEGAGIVQEVGPGVRGLKAGDHVVASFLPTCGRCRWCASGHQNLCDLGAIILAGTQVDGTYRRHAQGRDIGAGVGVGTFARTAPCRRRRWSRSTRPAAVPGVPPRLRSNDGRGSAVSTANVSPGDTVVVIGCGGIGSGAIQAARLAGAERIVAVDIVEAKRDKAFEFGATHFATSMPEATELVGELTRGVMADSALLTVGLVEGPMINEALDIIRKGGAVVLTALASVTDVTPTLPMLWLTVFQKRLLASLYGEANPRADIPRLLSLYREGKLLLDEVVTSEYKLNDINEAYDDMLAGRNIRGVVIHDH